MRGTKHENGKSSMPRLVWTLTGVGLCAGAVTLLIVNHALSRIRTERARTEAAQTELAASISALNAAREESHRQLAACLGGKDIETAVLRRPEHLANMTSDCVDLFAKYGLLNPVSAAALTTVDGLFVSFSALHANSLRWRKNKEQVQRRWQAADKRVRTTIRAARAAVEQLEGRQRLKRMALLRRYRQADKEEAGSLASHIVAGLSSGRDLSALKADLGDLALLAERLRREDEIDNLVSLKDNELRQILARMRLVVAKTEDDVNQTLAPLFDSVGKALFGESFSDDAAHQTLVVGDDGLYPLQHLKLIVERRGQALRAAVSENQIAIIEVERALGEAVKGLAQIASARMEETFEAARRNALFTGGVVFVVFVLMARRMATLGRRIETQLGQSNVTLKKEIIERQKTEASLRENEQRLSEQTANLHKAKERADSSAKRAEQALTDMERMNAVMMGREERVLEMKQEVNNLLVESGRVGRYEHV